MLFVAATAARTKAAVPRANSVASEQSVCIDEFLSGI